MNMKKDKVWDDKHLCFDCYTEVHDNEDEKNKLTKIDPSPTVVGEFPGYMCTKCEDVFAENEWDCQETEGTICEDCRKE